MRLAEVIIAFELLFIWLAIPTSNSGQLSTIRQELHNLNCKLDNLIKIMKDKDRIGKE